MCFFKNEIEFKMHTCSEIVVIINYVDIYYISYSDFVTSLFIHILI